jgi:hypothetical protein
MTMNQKLIFIIILILIILLIASYFGFNFFKKPEITLQKLEPKITSYKPNETPKYFPQDFPKDQNFKILSTKETIYKEDLVITTQDIESPYTLFQTIVLFKDYLKNNFWQITSEKNTDLKDNSSGASITAQREGNLILNFYPLPDPNKSLVKIEYQYNPKNPLKPQTKQVFKELPPYFPPYLMPSKTQIGGYSEDLNSYSPLLISDQSIESLHQFYLNTLKQNNWEIVLDTSNSFSVEILAKNKNTSKTLKVFATKSLDEDKRSIILSIQK